MLIDGSAENGGRLRRPCTMTGERSGWRRSFEGDRLEVAGSSEGLTVAEAETYALSATAAWRSAMRWTVRASSRPAGAPALEALRLGHELAQDQRLAPREGKPGRHSAKVARNASSPRSG